MSNENYENQPMPEEFDEEAQYDQDGAQPAAGNEPMDQLDRLLGYLSNIVESAPTVPLSSKRMINADMCLRIIDNIYKCLPVAIRQAQQILEERDQIIHEAEKDASTKQRNANVRSEAILTSANKEAEEVKQAAEKEAQRIQDEAEKRALAMMEKDEVHRNAKAEADRILNDARLDANRRKMEVNQYSLDRLRELEAYVKENLDAIQSSISNVINNQSN